MSIDERLKTLSQPKHCPRSQREDFGIRITNELIRYTSCSLGEHILTLTYVISGIGQEIHKTSKTAWKKLTRYILITIPQLYYWFISKSPSVRPSHVNKPSLWLSQLVDSTADEDATILIRNYTYSIWVTKLHSITYLFSTDLYIH